MSNQTVAQIEVNENLLVNLPVDQFIVFCSYLWNCPLDWKAETFWANVAQSEINRSFNEGWSYCKSSLKFEASYGFTWEYTTTSGTVLKASQSCGYNGDEFDIECSVEIPAHRVHGSTKPYLELAKAGLPYQCWYDYFYGDSEVSIAIHSIFSGKTPEEIRAEMLERETKKAEAKALAELETDSDEEFEECEEEEEYLDEE